MKQVPYRLAEALENICKCKSLENITFSTKNTFQLVSQKEFQRIIRDFFFVCYQWQIEQYLERPMEADELFVLHCYLLGGMEKVYERIETGMTLSVDHLVELLEFAMPEKSRRWFWASRKLPATGHKRDRKISFVRRVIAENFVGIFVHKYVKKISNDL